MPILTNLSKRKNKKLIDYIVKMTKDTTKEKGKRALYVLSCYFDKESIEKIIEKIKKALNDAQGHLSGVHIVVDVGNWIKSRASRDDIKEIIRKHSELHDTAISFTPVNVPNQLMHAKIYGVISKPGVKRGKGCGKRRGFIAISSGNLTERGLGFSEQYSNVEVVEIISAPSSLDEFVDIIENLKKNYAADSKNQDEFLQALNLLSLGDFYHKWDGNIGGHVRFKLTLTEKGKKARANNNDEGLFQGYTTDSETISRDPLQLSKIFEKVPKPFPKRFWASYSVDTLEDRWVPIEISNIVDNLLKKEKEPYVKRVKAIATDKKIKEISDKLSEDLLKYRKLKYVKEKEGVVKAWGKRIGSFRENEDLIQSCIFNYEKKDNLLDSLDRKTIIQTYKTLCQHLSFKQPRGIAKIILEAPKLKPNELKQRLNELTKCAEKMLEGHAPKKKHEQHR
jgi:hypothetical protein